MGTHDMLVSENFHTNSDKAIRGSTNGINEFCYSGLD